MNVKSRPFGCVHSLVSVSQSDATTEISRDDVNRPTTPRVPDEVVYFARRILGRLMQTTAMSTGAESS